MAKSLGTETTYQHTFPGDDSPTLVYRLPSWDPQKALSDCLERHSGVDVEKNEPKSNRQAVIEAIEGQAEEC
jgi:hypothetical protein